MKQRWQRLSARDRRVLAGGGVLAVALLLWAGAWMPLERARAAMRERATAQAEVLAWMRPAVAAALARGGTPTPTDGRSLLARVDAELRAAGLGGALISVEPQGERAVRAQFAAVSFDALGDWLQAAAGAGLHVEEMSLTRSGDGRVDARLLLGEGGH